MGTLTEPERELLRAMVALLDGGQTFELRPGDDSLNDRRWPSDLPQPTRNEIRSLVARNYLDVDRTVAPTWRFWPADAARVEFADDATRTRATVLKDPDARLGVILDAIVEAFEQDPAIPLLIVRTAGRDIIKHPRWAIEPDVVQMHDLRQLEDLGLIGWDGETRFFPSPRGRMASRNPAAFLAQRADEIEDEEERSRLRGLAQKFRAGDVAVGALGGVTAAAIRAALGL